MLNSQEKTVLLEALDRLTPAQQLWVESIILAFGMPRKFSRNPASDIISQEVLEHFGNQLISHHANSRQALSKDRFEFAFETALVAAGTPAQLVKSRTNRGHDIDIGGVPTNLKTEAAANIREDVIHISKWMELGKGPWDIDFQRKQFLGHMSSYERIFMLRRLKGTPTRIRYELVEIPKDLLLECETCEIEVCEGTTQSSKPAYVRVNERDGRQKYALYFDAGSERKLQVKALRKDLCVVHGTWQFGADIDLE